MSSGLWHPLFPLVLAAPSGTGKTTIARELVSRFSDFAFSVSATTRSPRPEEQQGRDYDFVSRATFEGMIEKGELAEWAEVHGNLYGTPKKSLEDAEGAGQHSILDIDVQGARQIRVSIPQAVLIFVFPPTAEVLRARLASRGTEDPEEVGRRLRRAREELGKAAKFDYVVVNDDLNLAGERIRAVVEAETRSPRRLLGLAEEVSRIRREIDELLAREGAREPTGG